MKVPDNRIKKTNGANIEISNQEKPFLKKRLKSFAVVKIISIFAIPNRERNFSRGGKNNADVAQLARARDL